MQIVRPFCRQLLGGQHRFAAHGHEAVSDEAPVALGVRELECIDAEIAQRGVALRRRLLGRQKSPCDGVGSKEGVERGWLRSTGPAGAYREEQLTELACGRRGEAR